MSYFFQGLTMGLAFVIPIGLQNLFVINSALSLPRKKAFLTALIVIFFDVSLSLSCFFGIGIVMQHYPWLQKVILLIGGLIVLYIGINLLISKPSDDSNHQTTTSLTKTISTAFIVTWANPQALVDGTMMLGAFHVTLPATSSTPFITGVAVASCLWFTSLTGIISIFKNVFNNKILRIINIFCGIIIMLYGTKLLYNFITLIFGK